MARTSPVHSGYIIIDGSGTGSNGNRIDVWVEYKLGTQNIAGNYTPITAYFYAALNPSYTSSTSYYQGLNSSFSVNGVAGAGVSNGSYDFTSSSSINLLGSYSGNIVHNADGTKKISITGSFTTQSSYISGGKVSTTVTLPAFPTYTLSISAGTGSSITVNRTASGYASTGNITHGARLYYGDSLKITFLPNTNYRLLTTNVNSVAFTSGNTHTVTGNVSVVSTAQILASAVGATNADIGSVSTITVTKYNDDYYHSLHYSFGSVTGYITSSGGVQSTETKFKTVSVPFAVPTAFYAQIPNAKTGTCTITCRTYSSSSSKTVLGNATTCTFTVTAAPVNCVPTITASVVDTNDTTIALTGDANKLIRYRSTAKCTVNATSRHSSIISSMSIAGEAVTGTTSGDVTTATKSFMSTDKISFAFAAMDSRGYSNSIIVRPTVINYIALTCNPLISRPIPTGDKIVMTVSGNIYRGSFGAYTNTLSLRYRYKESGGSYGSWQTVDVSLLTIGASSYRSTSEIELISYPITDENGETIYPGFDYHLDYEFQIRATDGADGYTLSTVDKYVTVNRGIPVFDWGENDFNVNVALMLSNTNILDIMYPVGAVYMHSGSTLPTAVSNVGAWTSISTGISGVYAWKRTA